MLNPGSASHPLVQFGEILKQVQDDNIILFQMLEINSQTFRVRIYASSGTSPGRGGPFGAVDFNAQIR